MSREELRSTKYEERGAVVGVCRENSGAQRAAARALATHLLVVRRVAREEPRGHHRPPRGVAPRAAKSQIYYGGASQIVSRIRIKCNGK